MATVAKYPFRSPPPRRPANQVTALWRAEIVLAVLALKSFHVPFSGQQEGSRSEDRLPSGVARAEGYFLAAAGFRVRAAGLRAVFLAGAFFAFAVEVFRTVFGLATLVALARSSRAISR